MVEIEETYDPEIKEVAVHAVNTIEVLCAISHLLTYFLDWRKLKVAVASILKLKCFLQERVKDVSTKETHIHTVQPKSGEELFQTECAIIQHTGTQSIS